LTSLGRKEEKVVIQEMNENNCDQFKYTTFSKLLSSALYFRNWHLKNITVIDTDNFLPWILLKLQFYCDISLSN
jgi:hypothetical protein